MDDREKLIKLLESNVYLQPSSIADYLISKGVAVRENGKWEHLGGDEWVCTSCGNVIFTEGSWEKPTQKFCDECGADMRGLTNNG